MNLPRLRLSASPFAAVISAAVALTLTGCALDSANPPSTAVSGAITGMLHGGPSPVVGATVTLYATQNNGYTGNGLQLAQTVSASDGSFSFNAFTYTCPAGQYAYIASASGNTGGNANNLNSVLMAAIGPCANLSRSTYVWVDEPSTIAAAYALSNFITTSGTGAATVVNVSSTANNNAASGSGSCTTTSGVTTSCTAAGLGHAFLNAANLVNASNSTGLGVTTATPTGQVYSSPPSNATTSSTAVALQNVVPMQEINSLANAVQACVNSTGTTGSGDTTSGCGQLFTNTTIPNTITSVAAYTTEPTNIVQALVNLAKFPFFNSANIYAIAQGSGFYQPTLTAAPPDYSIAIMWRSFGASNANQIGSVYYTTLDINDNVYATALTAPSTGSVAGAAPVIADALTSNGVGVWAAPASISTNTTNVCNVYAGTALNDPPCMAATDTLGHLWTAIGQSQSSQSGVFTTGYLTQIATSSGAVTQFTVPSANDDPLGLAIDKSNDVFFSTSNVSSTNDLYELPQGSTSSTTPTAVTFGGAAYQGAHSLGSLAFDASGNIWGSHNSGSGSGYIYGADTATFPAEAFGNAVLDCNNCSGGSIGTLPSGTANSEPSASVIDASGNYWFTGKTGVYEVPAGGGGGTGAGSTAYTLGTSGTQQMRLLSMDGAGTIFVPDSSSSGPANPLGPPVEGSPLLRMFYPAFPTQLKVGFNGCNTGGATGNTACISTNPGAPNNQMFYQSFNAAIDSTGSLWVSGGGNDAIIQIIGTAAPTWPQLSLLKPAVMPQ